MLTCFCVDVENSIPIYPLTPDQYILWLAEQSSAWKAWACQMRYEAAVASVCVFPNAEGQIGAVVVGLENEQDFWSFSAASTQLPKGCYAIRGMFDQEHLTQMAMAWALQSYQFNAYAQKPEYLAALYLPPQIEREMLLDQVHAYYLIRDLINTPTEDMGPAELAEAVEQVGEECEASVRQIIGEDLLSENFPLIHAVGRGAANQPRLVELIWGNPEHPRLTLVGKGVCYDSGGYSLKPSKSMLLMKKDMGGAAHALGLAYLIMRAKLPVYLRLLIPMVENLVSSHSYRPGDIFIARNGLSVEVTNTDAEGRLVLADALAYAAESPSDLLLDFATLTGASRVALGPDISAMMGNDQKVAHEILYSAEAVQDPICQLPLYQPYNRFIASDLADVANANTSGEGYAGAITAGLFLQRFVGEAVWQHFDIYAWHADSLAGRPKGAGVTGIRAVWHYLKRRFGA